MILFARIRGKCRRRIEARILSAKMRAQINRLDDPKEYTRVMQNGKQAFAEKDYEKSLRCFTKVIELSGGSFWWDYGNRVFVLHALNRREEALDDIGKAIELNPKQAKCYYVRGVLLIELRRYQESISDFSKAIELCPSYSSFYTNRGYAYSELGQYENALVDFGKAIKLASNDPWNYNNRGTIYTERKEFKKAYADLRRALKLCPEAFDIRHSLGVFYMERGEPGDDQLALEQFAKSIALEPNDDCAYKDRAKLYRRLGQDDLAERDEEKCRELENRDVVRTFDLD